jgi:anti-sigma regulatory factor (Ser/Thr protein kinase)
VDGLDVRVRDDGAGLDVLPDDGVPDLDAEGSRGLFLVRRLATDLQLLPSESGTTVRCRLPLEQVLDVPDQVRRDVAEPIL